MKNGVDFDTNSIITALNDGVSVSISELEQGYIEGTDSVVNGELYIDYTTADNKNENIKNVNWIGFKVVEASEGLTVVDGKIKVTKDGTVTLSDGISTVSVVISNYEKLVAKELTSQGVDITVMNGEVPAGSEAQFTALDEEQTAGLVEQYNIDSDVEGVAYSAFDVSIAMPEGGSYTESGEFAVAIDLPVDEKAGDFKLYHIHEGQVEELPVEVVDGKVLFTTTGFSEFVLSYTVDFEYNGYQFSMQGNDSMKLVDVLENLGIHLSDSDIIKAFFTDETLVQVFKAETDYQYQVLAPIPSDDSEIVLCAAPDAEPAEAIGNVYETITFSAGTWIVKSLKPFTSEEQLEVVTQGAIYVIDVRDAQNPDGTMTLNSTNTSSFTVSTASATDNINHNASLDLDFSFVLTTAALDEMKAVARAGSDPAFVYDFSSALKDGENNILARTTNVVDAALMNGKRQVGTYSIVDGKLTLTITSRSWFIDRSNFTGTFGLSIKIDEETTKNDEEVTFSFDGAGDIKVKFKKKTDQMEKTYNATTNPDGSVTLNYTAKIAVNQKLDNLQFNDTYSGKQKLDLSSVKIDGVSATAEMVGSNGFKITSDNFKAAIGSADGIPPKTYQVTYSTTVSASELLKNSVAPNEGTDETNTAEWNVDGGSNTPGGHTETRVPFVTPTPAPTPTPPPFEKSSTPETNATLTNAGEEITYVIEVGDANTTLNGLHVTDTMTDLQTLKDGKVYIAYGSPSGSREEMPSSAINWNNDGKYSNSGTSVFDYTFNTQNKGPAYIIYTTKTIDQATAKANGIYGQQTVGNNACLVNNNVWKSTQHFVPYREQEKVTVVKGAVASEEKDGKWQPGSTVTYTITIGTIGATDDDTTTLSNMHIYDNMTDMQKLNPSSINITILRWDGTITSITNVVKNSQSMPVASTVEGVATDDTYSQNTITAFDFYMPEDAGKGQATITYTTTLLDKDSATELGIFGDVNIDNTGYGGNGSGPHHGVGEYEPAPEFTVDKLVDGVESKELTSIETKENRTVTYTVKYGYDKIKKMDGITIKDEMTDIQKLVMNSDGTATITVNIDNEPEGDIVAEDGTVLLTTAQWQAGTHSFNMPMATSMYNEDGYSWPYFDDDSYSTSDNVRVFYYKLPNGIGVNTVTVTFQAEMISQAEANESGIKGDQHAKNTGSAENKSDETDVTVPFEKEVTHYPDIEKVFDHWDADNNKLYWKIIVKRALDSAYPLKDVTVSEQRKHEWKTTHSGGEYFADISFTYDGGSVSGNNVDYKWFDLAHAVITTESGTELQPVIDYTIDRDNASFHFNQLDEQITILLGVDSPIDPTTKQQINISNNFEMHNVVRVETEDGSESDEESAKYEVKEIIANKTSYYNSVTKEITYTVYLNRNCEPVTPDQEHVYFTDTLEEGVKVKNWSGSGTTPSIYVTIYANNNPGFVLAEGEIPVVQDGNTIQEKDLVMKQPHDQQMTKLSKYCYVVNYKVSVEDDWASVTSSETGYKDYENTATFRAGDKTYTGHTTTRVSGGEYIEKLDVTDVKDGFIVDNSGNNTSKIQYLVNLNKNGEQLNTLDNPTLQVTDYIDTNVELVTKSVHVFRVTVGEGGTETTEDITSTLDISYNDNIRLLSISKIPDKTYIRLTYEVDARSQGTDTYTNTVTVIGGGSHSSTVTKEHTISTNYATVGGDEVSVNLVKIDENNIATELNGAEFKLYKAIWKGRKLTNTFINDTLMPAWIESNYFNKSGVDYSAIKNFFEIDHYEPVTEAAHDSTHGNGKVYITADGGAIMWDQQLDELAVYAWEEVYAPDGYTGELNKKHWFIVYPEKDCENADKNPKYKVADYPWGTGDYAYIAQCIAWAVDNATSMANEDDDVVIASMASGTNWTATNIKDDKTTIEGTKEWVGDQDDLFDTRPENGIKLQLYKMKQGSDDKIPVGSPVPINADPDTGKWPTYTWYNLDKYYTETVGGEEQRLEWRYTIVEQQVPEYTTTYSDNGEGISSGTITVTNKLIPKNTDISVEKVFNPDGDHKPSQIVVELYKINTPLGGEAGEPEFTGKTAALTESNGWHYTFEKLPTRSADGYLTYTVIERQTAELEEYHYTVSYSDNQKGVGEGTITITNSLPGNLKITKTIAGLAVGDELTAEQKALIIFTVTGPNGYSTTFTYADMTGGVKTLNNLVPGEYVVTEVVPDESVPDGYRHLQGTYTVNSSENDNGQVTVVGDETAEVEIVNEYEKLTGLLKITKAVAEESAGTTQIFTFTVKLTTDGTTAYTGDVKVQSEGGSETTATPNANGEVTVTTTGAGEALIKDLPADTHYAVTEANVEGWRISSSSNLTGTIAAGTESQATVTNKEVTSISAKKTWSNSDTWLTGMSVTFKIMQYKGEIEQANFATTTAENTSATEVTISSQQTVTWNNLPKYYFDESNKRQEYTYRVVEINVQYNGVALETEYGTVYTVTGEGTGESGLVTVDNAPKKIKVSVTKVWEGDDESDRPDSISYTLSAKAGDTNLTYEDLGLANNDALTVTGSKTADLAYSAKWDDLPKYTVDGKKIEYSVTEDSVPNYYLKSTTNEEKETEWTWSFTNKKVSISISGTKAMENRNLTAEDVYSFTISATKGTPMPAMTKVSNAAIPGETTGAFTFGPIYYTKADMADVIAETPAEGVTTVTKEFLYEISEVKPENAADGLKENVVYDSTVYTAKVTLTYTYETGDITVSEPVFTVPNPENSDNPTSVNAITFINKDITDFDFTKQWRDGSTTNDQPWPKALNGTDDLKITVTLERRLPPVSDPSGTKVKDDNFSFTYAVSSTDATSTQTGAPTVVKSGTVNAFTFTINGLEKFGSFEKDNVVYSGEYEYFITEADMDFYNKTYLTSGDGSHDPNKHDAMDGEIIRNTVVITYELPSTGGPGITGFYVLGSILTLLALALLVTKKRSDGAGIE